MRREASQSRRGSRPAVLVGVSGAALGILQAWCVAIVLTGAGSLAPLLVFGVTALGRAALTIIGDRLAFEAGARARRRLRTDALARVLERGPALLRSVAPGEWVTTILDRIEAMDGLFARWRPAATMAWLIPCIIAAAAFAAVPSAGLILAGTGLLVPVGMAVAGIGAASASRRQFAALARLQARFLDRVRGLSTIVLAGRSRDEEAALARAARELRRRTMRVLRLAFLSSAFLDLATVAAIIVLALRIDFGDPAPSLFVLLLVPEFFAPLRAFSAAYQDRAAAAASAASLEALPPLAPLAAPALVRTVSASGITVVFEDVRVTWDPARGPALDGLSFRVPPGETLVLAGPSGCGKSTVIEVLLGFVRPEAGRVTLNGADLLTIVPQALSRLTAWIGQHPVLFAASIRDNIRFGRPDASEAEVLDAARAARVLAFADTLPAGLDTILGEGGFGLSGGQAQRVAVARAYLKDAPLLLMDEPTAHLDPATEADLLESLRRLTLNRTVILASHSSAAQAFGGRRLDLAAGRAVSVRAA